MTEPSSPSHPFAGTLTRAEFARIQQRMLPPWAGWYVLYPLVAVAILVRTLPGADLLMQGIIDVVVLAVLAVAIVVFTRRAHTRGWREAVRLAGRVHGAVSLAGIEWNTERSTARYEWGQIVRLDQTPCLTLVFFHSRSAFYFPRSFLGSDAAWAALNEAIRGWFNAAPRTTSPP